MLRLLIAEPQSLLREAVRIALEPSQDLRVEGEAADGRSAVARAIDVQPDVAVVDADLRTDDRPTVQAIVEAVPGCGVLALLSETNEERVVVALSLGAAGVVSRGAPLRDLESAVRAVALGEAVVPPLVLRRVIRRLIEDGRGRDEARRTLGRLTPREREVLALLVRGGDNLTIGRALRISPDTARTHVHNLLRKLSLHSRLEAAAFVLQRGLADDLEAELA